MHLRAGAAVATALFALVAFAPAAMAAREPLNAYRLAPTAENKQKLALQGFDMVEADRGGYLEIYGTAKQADQLESQGLAPRVVGQERRAGVQSAALPVPSDAPYTVWRRYDAVAGDTKEQYVELYNRLEGLNTVKKYNMGKTLQGRDIWALKVTRNAKTTTDGARPAVLYNAQQHAREWLAGETCRRTLLYFTSNYDTTPDNAVEEEVTELVNTRELWFSCISNPDGYEYTFTEGNRLWRKNMRDNNNNGILGEVGDGVDPNRNHSAHWGMDNEGSSDEPLSETFRGTGPASEPETQAMQRLWDHVDFAFQKNDHTAAELLLWPNGFQQYTPTPDDKLFEAYAGDDENPAIRGGFNPDGTWNPVPNRFDPDIGAELYITNGDLTDDAYEYGILAFTPEGTESDVPNVSGFEFPDDERLIEEEFQRHRLFSLDLAHSAEDPANPISHLENEAQNFYVESFADSYGDPQAVQVVAKKSLGDVKLRYRINDGAVKTVNTAPFAGGERFDQEPGLYYHRLRGVVTGTSPGDEVEVWFDGARRSSSHFTYRARSETGNKVLLMAAENYTAGNPAYPDTSGPNYLTWYTDALDANGVAYDIYDVDRRGNLSPDWLGVLSHYDAVIWYLGDDNLTRLPGQPPGTGTSRLAVEEMIDVRHFLNEGGKLFYTGKNAGLQYAQGNEFRNFGFPEPREDPDGEYCNKNGTEIDPPTPEFDEDVFENGDGCILHNDDFLQYHLGAYIYATPGNTFDDENNHPFPLRGRGPFEGLTWQFDETGANNQDHSATFVITSSVLDPARYPLFADSRNAADWLRPGAAPFDPYSGSYYLSAGAHSTSYKRYGKVLDLTGRTAPKLTFKFSGDVEEDWDWFIVEVRDVTTNPNSDAWTTLPEADTDGAGDADTSLTTQGTGESCPEGLSSDLDAPHPFLNHYWNADGECGPQGTTGAWHAFTGSSGGWTDWTVDLSQYAGKKIDIRLSTVTDWGTLGLGTWIDDLRLSDGNTTLESNDFETDTGAGWTIGPPPAGTDNPTNGWNRRTKEFQEGGVVTTNDTVLTGFGFEGINETARNEFMKRTLTHLGVLSAPPPSGGGGSNTGTVEVGGTVPPTTQGAVAPATAKSKRASARIKSSRTLRVDRRGRLSVRVACTGDAGAVCRGTLKLARGSTTYGSKQFKIAAGKTATVKLTLRAKARRAMKSGRTVKATLSTGALRQAVRLR